MRALIFSLTILFFSILSVSPMKASEVVWIEGTIGEGETFSGSLASKGIPIQWINLMTSQLAPFVDFKNIRTGLYRFLTDEKGGLVKFIYEVSSTEVYEVVRNPEGKWIAQKREVSLETRLVRIEGEIRSSLARAIRASGERNALSTAVAEVLAWQMDFSRDARKADQFKVLVEKKFKEDRFIQYGPIHALEYQGERRVIKAIQYHGKFYNEKGESLGKGFLRVPLRYDYVSSEFNRERRHPIMGGILPHLGVDYAAPIGTPVWAIADGIVMFCGWAGGFGKQVALKHPGGFMSYYSHLSRYGPGIKKEIRVKQKQVIGYVGSTGFSTGPHLDFRISKDDHFLDPLKTENFPTGQPIGKKEKEAFQQRRDQVMSWLREGPPPIKPLDEVTHGTVKE